MLDDIKAALLSQKVQKVAIVDDLYDPEPAAGQIDEADWNVFYDDVDQLEIDLIQSGFGEDDIHAARPGMDRDRAQQFVTFLWQRRADSQVFADLFNTYSARAAGGRTVLDGLYRFLETDLGLKVERYGSKGGGDEADIVFLDLFLGVTGDLSARKHAIERISRLVAERPENPPLVVLMSSSPHLEDMKETFRDDAELLGCQFRTLPKADIEIPERMYEVLYRLVVRYQDTLQLANFVSAWGEALASTAKNFLRRIRRLDLRDYADIQALILDAEKDEVGSYLLEVYDRYFHFLLEGNESLATASKGLDSIKWAGYAPPHFLPASEPAEIMDGLLFHDVRVLQESVGLGDILAVHLDEAAAKAENPPIEVASGHVRFLVVLTQACDLQHGRVSRVLMLGGTGRPSQLVLHMRPEPEVTPVLVVGGNRYVVEWNVTDPVSCTPAELKERLSSGQYRRARRFRLSHALQLQQRFAANLTRVGTMVMPPLQHVAGLHVFYRAKDGELRLLESFDPAQRQAVVMVGRDTKKVIDYFMMSYELVDRVRTSLRKLSLDEVHDPNKWKAMLAQREPFAALEAGVTFKRDGRKRPWKEPTEGCPDILELVGPYETKNLPTPGTKVDSHTGPLVFQIWLGPTAKAVIAEHVEE